MFTHLGKVKGEVEVPTREATTSSSLIHAATCGIATTSPAIRMATATQPSATERQIAEQVITHAGVVAATSTAPR